MAPRLLSITAVSTSNELDIAIDEAKAALEATGVSKDAYKITYKKANKSLEECK